MTSINEMLKGLSDIPIALLALVFGVRLWKNKKEWSLLFFLISVSAVLGTLVHTIDFTLAWNRLIWIVLYIFLYELIRRFAYLMVCYVSVNKVREKPCEYMLEVIFYAVTLVFMFAFDINDIYVFVIYALIMLVRTVGAIFKYAPAPFKAPVLMTVLLLPLILQAFAFVIPYAVLIEHIIIAAALFIAFALAGEERKD